MKQVFLSKDSRHTVTLKQDDDSEVVILIKPLDSLTLLSLMEEHEATGDPSKVNALPLVIDFVRLSVTKVSTAGEDVPLKFQPRQLKYRTAQELDEDSLAMFTLEAITALGEEVAALNKLGDDDSKNS